MSLPVTVVLPTHRRPTTLPRAIASVLAQTHTELELLVVDDGPDPATEHLVRDWPDPRTRYLAHPTNLGVAAARNTGLRAASGELVAFLDDDDEWLPRKLELQLARLAEAPETVGAVSCFERWIGPDGRAGERRVSLDGRVHRALLRHDRVNVRTLVVRRRCFDRIGHFDERLWGFEDLDLALRLSRHVEFRTVPEVLVLAGGTPTATSRTTPRRIRSLELFIDKHPEIRESRELRSRWLVRLARLHADLGDRERCERTLRQALRTDPSNVRALAMWTTGRARLQVQR